MTRRVLGICHLLMGCVVILLGSTSLAQTIGQHDTNPPAGTYEVVEQPTTLLGMLRNIDVARKQRLLLREDFYSDANLKRFFGALAVKRNNYWREKGTSGWVTDLGQMIGPKDIGGGRQISGFSFSFDWHTNDAGLVEAGFGLTLGGKPRVEFDDVERIFGPNWTHPEPSVPPDGPYQSGNETIEYEYVSSGTSQLLGFNFNPDATLAILSVFAKEIK